MCYFVPLHKKDHHDFVKLRFSLKRQESQITTIECCEPQQVGGLFDPHYKPCHLQLSYLPPSNATELPNYYSGKQMKKWYWAIKLLLWETHEIMVLSYLSYRPPLLIILLMSLQFQFLEKISSYNYDYYYSKGRKGENGDWWLKLNKQ